MKDWKDALSALATNSETPNTPNDKEITQVRRKKRLGIVYSTNANFDYTKDEVAEEATLPPLQQKLRIRMERAGRGGKTVTLISGFIGTENDLQALCKKLKQKCGVGGSAKEGVIIMQGDLRDKLVTTLKKEGFSQTK